VDRKLLEELAKASAIYLVLIAATIWFLNLQPVSFNLDTSFGQIRVNFSPLFQPILAILICFYASKVSSLLIRGRVVEPLTRMIKYLGFGLAIILVDRQRLIPVDLSTLGYLVLLLVLVIGPHAVAKVLLKERGKEIYIYIIDAAALLAIGYALGWVWTPVNERIISIGIFNAYNQDPLLALISNLFTLFFGNLATVIQLSFTITAALALLGLWRFNPNSYLSLAAGRLSSGLPNKFLIVFIAANYFMSLRGLLINSNIVNTQLITVAEWGILCISVAYIYINARKYIDNNLVSSNIVGNWGNHIQKVSQVDDREMKRVSGMIDAYINKGEKSQLVIYLADLFRGFGLSSSNIGSLLSPMISHRDANFDRSMLSWRYKLATQQEVHERRIIMDKLLAEVKGFSQTKADTKSTGEVNEKGDRLK